MPCSRQKEPIAAVALGSTHRVIRTGTAFPADLLWIADDGLQANQAMWPLRFNQRSSLKVRSSWPPQLGLDST